MKNLLWKSAKMPPQLSGLLSIDINYWVLQTIAMVITCILLPNLRITSPFGALFAVIAISLINQKVWDTALFFSIPNHFTTQAVYLFLANGAIFWLIVKFLPGIEVKGFVAAFFAPVVFTVTSLLISRYLKDVNWVEVYNLLLAKITEWRSYFEQAGAVHS